MNYFDIVKLGKKFDCPVVHSGESDDGNILIIEIKIRYNLRNLANFVNALNDYELISFDSIYEQTRLFFKRIK